MEEGELDLSPLAVRGVLRVGPRAAHALFDEGPGFGEAPLPQELARERTADRVVFGVGFQEILEDLLASGDVALLEEDRSEEPPDGAVFRPSGGLLPRALLRFAEP